MWEAALTPGVSVPLIVVVENFLKELQAKVGR
jgi:hypothetical protein